MVKSEMARGDVAPSFVSQSIEDSGGVNAGSEYAFHLIELAATSIYSGGADTTVSATVTFFLQMALNPNEQAKAQEELDQVVGRDRMPNMSDRDQLPYVEAVLKEVLRMQAVVPLGVPHVVTEECNHAGFRLPMGATVIPNIQAMLHDQRVYPSPHLFMPTRHILGGKGTIDGLPGTDPRKIVFGFGRRICPGLSLADDSMWLTIATVLSTFYIEEPKGSHTYSPGMIRFL